MRTLFALVTITLTTAAVAEPALPYIKGAGQCASDYVQSGAYCNPKNDRSRAAVPKIGQCPSSWTSSGNSCQHQRK